MNPQRGSTTLRVATWNIDWARRARVHAQQAEVIARAAADVWVLTEARADVLPPRWASATSAMSPTANSNSTEDAGFFAIVGAPELRCVDVPELPTAAAALVPIAGQRWLVLGVFVPWRRNVPPLPEGAAPDAENGPAQWRMVLTQLDAALERLSPLVVRR